ncbi:MAG TPA: hypothetical protein ENJ19_08410 [Gammaproteobacteria bacterium]|nr:hypothetical protein [Gammaproteobacteria bacterium]
MKEIIIYLFLSISSTGMLAYTVHMFLGGVVSERTEHLAMGAAVVIWAGVIAFLWWDVLRRRRGQR